MTQAREGIRDITIIGGGPTGLFAAFYAGMRGVSSRIVDSLPELGGQLTALYPEKYIFDVGGLPKILAKDLASDLVEQAMQFEPEVILDEEVQGLFRDEEDVLRLTRTAGWKVDVVFFMKKRSVEEFWCLTRKALGKSVLAFGAI